MNWVAERNRPVDIVQDPEFRYPYTVAWPNLVMPSPNTVRRDIKVIYAKCRDRVTTLLRNYPGRIHLGTDAWTSTNHHALVAWTVHFIYEGRMMAFLLDIVELAGSHTGLALAEATQQMLKSHELETKVRQILLLLFQSLISSCRSSLSLLTMQRQMTPSDRNSQRWRTPSRRRTTYGVSTTPSNSPPRLLCAPSIPH